MCTPAVGSTVMEINSSVVILLEMPSVKIFNEIKYSLDYVFRFS